MKNKKFLVLVATILCISSPLIACASDKVPEKDNPVISEKDDSVTGKEVSDTVLEPSEEGYELEVINGDRVFKSDVAPKLKLEEIALNDLKQPITESISEENLNNKFYTKEITVHSLGILTSDEIQEEIGEAGFMEELTEINPYAYEIVRVNFTIKQTEEFNKVAQFSNGTYTRYYVVMMENEDSDWKIYTMCQ